MDLQKEKYSKILEWKKQKIGVEHYCWEIRGIFICVTFVVMFAGTVYVKKKVRLWLCYILKRKHENFERRKFEYLLKES